MENSRKLQASGGKPQANRVWPTGDSANLKIRKFENLKMKYHVECRISNVEC
jgi:hypothetical protein